MCTAHTDRQDGWGGARGDCLCKEGHVFQVMYGVVLYCASEEPYSIDSFWVYTIGSLYYLGRALIPPFLSMYLHMWVLFLQTPRDGKVARGTQVVFHEARVDPDLVTRLDRRHITGSTGGLLQSYTFLKCHSLLNILGVALQILLLQFSCFSPQLSIFQCYWHMNVFR